MNDELLAICQKIVREDLALEKWAEIESCDMFQSPNFCGGFDANERAFLFSWHANETEEYWFQLYLDDVEGIAYGDSIRIMGWRAEK